MLLSVILMVALAASLAWGISKWFTNVRMLNTVTIGIVLPENSGDTDMIVRLISGMESVQSICAFSYVDREDMEKGLKSGDLQVAVELTEDFYDDVNNGVNTPLTVFFAGNSDMSSSVFKELLYDGIGFTQVTEAAIYSVVDLRDTYELKMSVWETQEFLTEFYLWNVFKRGETFDNVVLSATGEIDFGQYYYSVAVMFFLLLGSLLFGFLYKEEENEMLKTLSVRGLTPSVISLVRMIVISLYAYFCLCIFYLGGCFVCNVLESDMLTFNAVVPALFLPLSLSMGAFSHFVYSAAKSRVIGTITMLGINLFMLILAGGILPIAFFPEIVQKIGGILPLRFWMDYFQRYCFGKGAGYSVWISLAFSLFMYLGATVFTSYRLVRSFKIKN